MQRASCRATRISGHQSAEMLDLRSHCLGQRLEEERAVVETLRHADLDLVLRAPQVAEGLSSIAACANPSLLRGEAPAPDPGAGPQVQEARAEAARANARMLAGQYAQAIKLVGRAERLAVPTADHALVADVLFIKGRTESARGNHRRAELALRESGAQADLARRDDLVARAWTSLISVVGVSLQRPDEGVSWASYALAAIARYGGDAKLEAEVELRESNVLPGEAGLPHARKAVDLLHRIAGPPSAMTAALDALGEHLTLSGRAGEAVPAFSRALQIEEARRLPYDAELPLLLTHLARADLMLNRPSDALPLLERAIARWSVLRGPRDDRIADGLGELGQALWQLGRLREAESAFRRSVDIMQTQVPPSALRRAVAAAGLGEVLVELGEPRQALPFLEASCPVLDGAPGAVLDGDRAECAFELARALWDAKGDRARARSLAHSAREIAKSVQAPVLPGVTAWLAARPVSRP